MSAARKTSGYAPGSNRGVNRTIHQAPTTRLTDEQRALIQQRLRRHYLADDARPGFGPARPVEMPERLGWIARLRASVPSRPTGRPSLRQAQQH